MIFEKSLCGSPLFATICQVSFDTRFDLLWVVSEGYDLSVPFSLIVLFALVKRPFKICTSERDILNYFSRFGHR